MDIILNIQGQIFETDYNTILKIPYFKDMFEHCGRPNEIIFVNRSSHIFKHVLGLITDSFYPYPIKYKFELNFYGIDYKDMKLYDKSEYILKDLQLLKHHVGIREPPPIAKPKDVINCVVLGCDNPSYKNIHYPMKYCGIHIKNSDYCGVSGCSKRKLLLDYYCNDHYK